MSTTTTVQGIAIRKGPHRGGDLHCLEVAIAVNGTYAQGAHPSFDLLTALQAERHQGISAVNVTGVTAFQDGDDGTNVYTAPNADVVLSGTGNQTVTFQIHSGATDGATGTELANGTSVQHIFSFIVIAGITGNF